MRRGVIFSMLFLSLALTPLVAPRAGAQHDTPAGTNSIRGVLCPDAWIAPDQCTPAESIGAVTITTPDAWMLTLADATLHGAGYVWEDVFLVFRTYTVDLAGMTMPANFTFSTLAGANVFASNT